MKRFFKTYLVFLLSLVIIFLGGCTIDNPGEGDKDDDNREDQELVIYSVNDFHGMVFETSSGVGISKLGKYLNDLKKADDNTIILSAGDMFQGSAVSSMSRGRAVVDCMNYIGFDAMTLGNHEFDWGIEEVAKYWDKSSTNGEANFPIIVSNVMDKTTYKLASWATPYTVFEKNGIKIGVVGVIGSDEEADILATYVKNYDFTDELSAIKKYTKILRTTENCDVVIISSHSDTSDINDQIASLTGDEKVDAILNGHTHRAYYGEITRSKDLASVPYVQSGCYGKYIGKITLTYSFKEKTVTDCSATYLKADSYCKTESSEINTLLANYQNYIDIANEELGVSGINFYKDQGGIWASNVIKRAGEADFGIVNSGGIRANGFPINSGSMITYGDIFEIMPFENMIRTVEIKGSEIINTLFKYSDSNYISTNVDIGNQTIDGVKIDPAKYYKVATIDYLFEKTWYPFLDGINRIDTDLLFRDALAQAVKDSVAKNNKFIAD